MSRVAGAVGSTAVHVAILLAMVWPQQPAAQPPVKATPQHNQDEADMVLVPESESYGDGLTCENWYRGIGVIVGFTGLVEEVVERGPADRAGLKVGDRFFNEQLFIRDAYAIGHRLTLRIERGGSTMELPVTIGRVCYSTPHTIPHLRGEP